MTLSDRIAPTASLLISILSLGKPKNVMALLTDLPRWLAAYALDSGTDVHVVVRNNDPNADFISISDHMDRCEADFPMLRFTLLTGEENFGFGRSHNENFRLYPATYLLIMNDDIGLPNLNWLPQAVALLAGDPQLACVAAAENPQYLNPMFGNGHKSAALAVETLKYAEASLLLLNGAVFAQLGMFDERLQWAMFEDADLSLRMQRHGFRIRWISMPHEHWRSMTVNSLPGPVRSAILEHNRASLFAGWGQTLATGRIGRIEIFDIWSDGMGDVFCALPHLMAWLQNLTPLQRAAVVINTSYPELLGLLDLQGVRVVSVSDPSGLQDMFSAEGISALHTTRDINYALPMNIHSLICGALSVPAADHAAMQRFGDLLPLLASDTAGLPERYCVVHMESVRDHAGRAFGPAAIKTTLGVAAALFETIVLVGRERRLTAELCQTASCQVIDLQGKLSVSGLIAIVAKASQFIGLDSFPAHVAQAAGVPAAIIFGSVHPLARVWHIDSVWPLVAALACTGCYHTHLESSAPFCMRRDEECMGNRDVVVLQQTLEAMRSATPFQWSAQFHRFQALQAKWVGFMRHHPAPPERLLRPPITSNERISHFVYQMMDRLGELVGSGYRTTSIAGLTEEVRRLEAKLFAREAELDEVRRRRHERTAGQSQEQLQAREPVKIVQLNTIALQQHRCTTMTAGPWLEVSAQDDDPRLCLPAICGRGGRVQFRLVGESEQADSLQVFWALGKAAFSEESQRAITLGGEAGAVDLAFDLAQDQVLWLRIDPLSGRGKMRLRGSLSGTFDVLDRSQRSPQAVRDNATPEPSQDAAPKRQPRKRVPA